MTILGGKSTLRWIGAVATIPEPFCYHPALVGGGLAPRRPLLCASPLQEEVSRTTHADRQPTRSQGPPGAEVQGEDACAAWRTAKAGRLYARLHDDAEEAELGPAQGRPRAPDEPDGGRRLHPR